MLFSFFFGFRLSLLHELTFGVELYSISVFLNMVLEPSSSFPWYIAPSCYVVVTRCPVLDRVRLPHLLRVRSVISLYKFRQSLPHELSGPEVSSIVQLLNIQIFHFNDRNNIELLLFQSMCTNPSGFYWWFFLVLDSNWSNLLKLWLAKTWCESKVIHFSCRSLQLL